MCTCLVSHRVVLSDYPAAIYNSFDPPFPLRHQPPFPTHPLYTTARASSLHPTTSQVLSNAHLALLRLALLGLEIHDNATIAAADLAEHIGDGIRRPIQVPDISHGLPTRCLPTIPRRIELLVDSGLERRLVDNEPLPRTHIQLLHGIATALSARIQNRLRARPRRLRTLETVRILHDLREQGLSVDAGAGEAVVLALGRGGRGAVDGELALLLARAIRVDALFATPEVAETRGDVLASRLCHPSLPGLLIGGRGREGPPGPRLRCGFRDVGCRWLQVCVPVLEDLSRDR